MIKVGPVAPECHWPGTAAACDSGLRHRRPDPGPGAMPADRTGVGPISSDDRDWHGHLSTVSLSDPPQSRWPHCHPGGVGDSH
eukprot:237809-Hanusia_phi.AAC.1